MKAAIFPDELNVAKVVPLFKSGDWCQQKL